MVIAEAVHTTGINWESIAVIVGSVVAVVTFLAGLQERRSAKIREEIREAIANLTEVLTAKLETKDVVNALRIEVAKLQERMNKEGRHG